ncbi:MAG: hypothetical protein EBQ80_02460, partial [Proteobacteria bacterium]|nr:hypothetical protein [Pseudomonadota bacterium]
MDPSLRWGDLASLGQFEAGYFSGGWMAMLSGDRVSAFWRGRSEDVGGSQNGREGFALAWLVLAIRGRAVFLSWELRG